MQKIIIFSLLMLSFVISVFSQTNEEEVIKQTIKNETLGYFQCDFDTWEGTILKADHFSFVVTDFNNPGSLFYRKGKGFYDNLSKHLQSKGCKSGEYKIELSEWDIQVREKVAWAIYKESVTRLNDSVIEARTTKILEKKEGHWKIVAISSIYDFDNETKSRN